MNASGHAAMIAAAGTSLTEVARVFLSDRLKTVYGSRWEVEAVDPLAYRSPSRHPICAVRVRGAGALTRADLHFRQSLATATNEVRGLGHAREYLPDRQRPWVQAILRRAYTSDEPAKAQRLLTVLARRLEDEFPSAADSVREGLAETLTVVGLPLSPRLRRSLATTNPIESLMSRTRHVHRNVKRWRNGKMMIRWTTAAVFEGARGFRRLKGCKALPALVTALRRRDEQLGLTKPAAAEHVA